MDFIFKPVEQLSVASLGQGDLIAKTDVVVERLAQAHNYYASSLDYTHFSVITQTCDLVRRRGEFKAPYITIAAVKPFKLMVQERIMREVRSLEASDFTYLLPTALARTKQLLERHLNNTEPDHFFLPADGHQNIAEDLVVYLRLTVALRKEHYDALASAKIAELEDVFQAKLGWLVGNIYSRVGTPDIEEKTRNPVEIKQAFYQKYIPQGAHVTLSSVQKEMLKKLVKERAIAQKRNLSRNEVLELMNSEILDDTEIIARNIVSLLIKRKLIDPLDADGIKKWMAVIANEPTFKSLVKAQKDG